MSESVMALWPTPAAMTNRKSRRALTPSTNNGRRSGGGQSSPPGLEQAVELAEGITPKEMVGLFTASRQLTLFAEAFPASPIPWLAAVPAPTTTATSGPSSPDSFASVDPDGSWRKTCQGYSQVTLDGSLARYSETWPRAGMTRSGIAYRRVPLAPLTGATASGSWPTPTVGDSKSAANATAGRTNPHSQHHDGVTLTDAIRLWPTPNSGSDHWNGTMQEWGGSGSWIRRHPELATGSLNPTWVEWLMGYPSGWTACAASATRLSRRSPNGSGKGFKRAKPSHTNTVAPARREKGKGASLADGAGAGSPTGAERTRTSHQRRSVGQPIGESASDACEHASANAQAEIPRPEDVR